MHQIDLPFIKLDDDETCALLKPATNAPPITQITNEIIQVMSQFPEVKRRVLARLATTGGLEINV